MAIDAILIPAAMLITLASGVAVIGGIANVVDSNSKNSTVGQAPKTKRPIGRDRRMMERQRARIAETERRAKGMSLDAEGTFGVWFDAGVLLPEIATAEDVIPFEAWAKDYLAFCARKGSPHLDARSMLSLMEEYARVNQCAMGTEGEFVGGQLKK